MSKQVAKKETTELARPAFMKGAGRGSENVTVEDLVIPRLDVIQDLSPQRKKNDPKYIDGAEEGMLFNSVSGQLYGTEVIFVPVYFRKEWVIWKDRKKGGGFFGAFPSREEAEAQLPELEGNAEDYIVTDTAQHFGLIVDDHTSDNPQIEEIVISMSKSKMKASRQLNTMVRMAGGDRFERAYKVQAVADQNKAGESFYNLGVKPLGYVSEPVYRAAEKVYEAVVSGAKDVVRDEE